VPRLTSVRGRRSLHPSDVDLSPGALAWWSRGLERCGFEVYQFWFRHSANANPEDQDQYCSGRQIAGGGAQMRQESAISRLCRP